MRVFALLSVLAALAAAPAAAGASTHNAAANCQRVSQLHLRCEINAVRSLSIKGALSGSAKITMVLFVGCSGGPALKDTVTLQRSFGVTINARHPVRAHTPLGGWSRDFASAIRTSSGQCQIDLSFKLRGTNYKFASALRLRGA